MSAPPLPTEIIQKIVYDVGNDVATLRMLSLIHGPWSCVSRHRDRFKFTFEGAKKIVDFLDLISSPDCTFVKPIRCESVCVKATAMTGEDMSPVLDRLMASVVVEESLTIHVTTGNILEDIAETLKSCTNIRKLTLVGGSLSPSTFFDLVGSFPHLQALQLHAFTLVRDDRAPAVQYTFPPGLTQLSFVQASSLWSFFRAHGVKLAGIRELHVADRFTFQDEGVVDMLHCLREMQDDVRTLELEALYDTNSRDLDRDMRNIFWSSNLTLFRIRGLEELRLNFAQVPAKFALGCLAMYTIYLPFTNITVNVKIDVPQSLLLWDNDDPTAQLQQLRGEMNPPGTPAVTSLATLTVQGFPGPLPGDVQATRTALVGGYPVGFVDK